MSLKKIVVLILCLNFVGSMNASLSTDLVFAFMQIAHRQYGVYASEQSTSAQL